MSLLTKIQIEKELSKGTIVIKPYPRTINPNSVNLTLNNELLVYEKNYTTHLIQQKQYNSKQAFCLPSYSMQPLDVKVKENTCKLIIPEEGMILWPGVLYLGSTVEYTETHGFAPFIEGRSSMARLGLTAHLAAGFGDQNFSGKWTLELTVVHPLRIYPYIEIAQVAYSTLEGLQTNYSGRYQNQDTAIPSKLYEDYKEVK